MSTCLKMTRELAKRLLMLKPLIKLLDIQFFPVVLPVVLQCIALPYESHVTRNLARMRRGGCCGANVHFFVQLRLMDIILIKLNSSFKKYSYSLNSVCYTYGVAFI